ncbi:ferredoxin-type protein NapF [Persephonella sp.]
MSRKMDRRGFLKALPFIPSAAIEEIKKPDESEEKDVIRPPYISENSDFSKCAGCEGNCITSCEEKILFRLKDGSPKLVFGEKGCTFCRKCAESCEFEVLSVENPERVYVNVKINFSKCMAWNGVMCFSCKEPCIYNAIKFEGLFKPQILPDLCTGCGFCVNICPSGAIEVFPVERESGLDEKTA